MKKVLVISISAALFGLSATAFADETALSGVSAYGATGYNQDYKIVDQQHNTLKNHAFQNADGINSVQQNNGSNNSMQQGTAVSVNTPLSGGTQTAAAMAGKSTLLIRNLSETLGNVQKNDVRDRAFQNADGINSVQQNNGGNNAMQQGVAVAANSRKYSLSQKAYAGAGASAAVLGNTSLGVVDSQSNVIQDRAFQNADGINSVQQNNGANNSMQQDTAVAVNRANPYSSGIASQYAWAATGAGASVFGNSAGNSIFFFGGSQQSNDIRDRAFQHADGIKSVQQNNGANNSMQQETAVAVNDLHHGLANKTAVSTTTLASAVGFNSSFTYHAQQTNTIQDHAFQYANGINTVAQNNGSNNAMQQSVSVSVNR